MKMVYGRWKNGQMLSSHFNTAYFVMEWYIIETSVIIGSGNDLMSFGAKPLPESMMIYCHMHAEESQSMWFKSKYNILLKKMWLNISDINSNMCWDFSMYRYQQSTAARFWGILMDNITGP